MYIAYYSDVLSNRTVGIIMTQSVCILVCVCVCVYVFVFVCLSVV